MSQLPVSSAGKRQRARDSDSDSDDSYTDLIRLENQIHYRAPLEWDRAQNRARHLRNHHHRNNSTNHQQINDHNYTRVVDDNGNNTNQQQDITSGSSDRSAGLDNPSDLDEQPNPEVPSCTCNWPDNPNESGSSDNSGDSDSSVSSYSDEEEEVDDEVNSEHEVVHDDEDEVMIEEQSDSSNVSSEDHILPRGLRNHVRHLISADGNDIMVIEDSDTSDASSSYSDYHGVMRHADFFDADSFSVNSADAVGDDCPPEEYLKYDPTPDTPYPKPDWITPRELRSRKLGFASSKKQSRNIYMHWFERYAGESLWMIQRMNRTKKLESHSGCVNSLDFNTRGDRICSGSDDQTVCIWDWRQDKPEKQLVGTLITGHRSNIYQSKFCLDNTHIATTSRDGTVRLMDIQTNQSEVLLRTSGEIECIDFLDPHTLITCSTKASIHQIDIREKLPRKICTAKDPISNLPCELHTIASHPLDERKITVAGSSPFVYVFDLRRSLCNGLKPIYLMGHKDNMLHKITSIAYNSLGDKLLISYNDDDLYVCQTNTCEIIHRYRGHRNKYTIKNCAWFGDNYVMSGSDDGHIYGWDLNSEHIVCFLEADENVVNCINKHPSLPILASSGFDFNVKIWEPTSDVWPQTMRGIKPQICKNNLRRTRWREEIAGRIDGEASDLEM